MRFSKKASLNLSINAIVILILAITMLGLGLGFMKKTFGGAIGQFEDVSDDIKATMIAELEASNERLVFNKYDIQVKEGTEKEIYYAINNDGDAVNPVVIKFKCTDAIANDECLPESCPIDFKTFDTKTVEANDNAVLKVIIAVPSNTAKTTYSCEGLLGLDGDYAKKEFFITVI